MQKDVDRIYGVHAVQSVLDDMPERVLTAYVATDRKTTRLGPLIDMLDVIGCRIERVDRQRLDTLAGGGRHQGIVLDVKTRAALNENILPELIAAAGERTLILVLDSVQDPRNLGACLRVADGAGASAVVAPKNRAAGLTQAARKVASGASVPFVQVTNLARSLRMLKDAGLRIVGTSDAAADQLYDADLCGPLALVLGGEQKGLRRLTREACDQLVAIPMHGSVSSLNVSVAAGVALYEAVRQRG